MCVIDARSLQRARNARTLHSQHLATMTATSNATTPVATSSIVQTVILCPGQGAQSVGMAKAWGERSPRARAVIAQADRIFADGYHSASACDGRTLSDIAFNGPQELLNRTDISQPALFTAAVACFHALPETISAHRVRAFAGLSLGEYTALHLGGAFSFEDGLRLVMRRGQLMQHAAETSKGSMVALIGADETQAEEVCARATAMGGILVPANFNAPGQIVLSGSVEACDNAITVAGDVGVRGTKLQVAGAFHSPLMASAAEAMREVLAKVSISPLAAEVWSNVTALPHERANPELLRQRLVEQLVSPVRWSQSCASLLAAISADGTRAGTAFHELAPGSVLKGLMRRIDKTCEVVPHDQPHDQA